MASNSSIEWTDDTWNPWTGCLKVSPGCKNCYMYRDKKRHGQDAMIIVRSKAATFNAPLKKYKGPLVFTCSWTDFFIPHADKWRSEAWDIIRQTPHLTYQILTKRPEFMPFRLPEDWGNGWGNVWLGVSVELADYLWRIDELENIPAVIKFVSYEPALEYVDFKPYANTIDWLISGGESGFNARPANLDWFRQVRDDCERVGIDYFHKQHGGSKKIDGAYGGMLLDGKCYHNLPVEVKVSKIEKESK